MGKDDRADLVEEEDGFKGEEEQGLAELAGFGVDSHGDIHCAAEKDRVSGQMKKEAGVLIMAGTQTIH